MNWDQFRGKFMQVEGAIRQKWAKLSADDLEDISGDHEKLVGRIQERYGVAREEAEKEAEEWWSKLGEAAKAAHR